MGACALRAYVRPNRREGDALRQFSPLWGSVKRLANRVGGRPSMNARLGVLVLGPSLVLFSLLGSSAYAEPPTQERTHSNQRGGSARPSTSSGSYTSGHSKAAHRSRSSTSCQCPRLRSTKRCPTSPLT